MVLSEERCVIYMRADRVRLYSLHFLGVVKRAGCLILEIEELMIPT